MHAKRTLRHCLLVALILRCSIAFAQQSDAATLLDARQARHALSLAAAEQSLIFQHLIPGETYRLRTAMPPGQAACLPSLDWAVGSAEILAYDPVRAELHFRATQAELPLELRLDCSWGGDAAAGFYLSLDCQTCQKKTIQDWVQAESSINLAVQPNIPADILIRDVLVGGDCFDISNISYFGQPAQIGTFSNGFGNIGFSEGVIMATGNVLVATGANAANNAAQGYGNYTPDSDLFAASNGGNPFDMASIEFDFRPTQPLVSFEFVFASEEYCEYVGSPFNDVFGFFISGPGINGPYGDGAENIALVPATSIPVAINNVNHLDNTAYFINNTPAGLTLCGQAPSTSPVVNQIQFDGFTQKITVIANLQTCKTYRFKLKIADVEDGIFDSAVFLRAGSFNAGATASVHWAVDGNLEQNQAYEGCNSASLVFRRVGGNPNAPLVVPFAVAGSATPGVDYSALPSSVTIPAGQQQLVLPVTIFTDANVEGSETVRIILANLCNCSDPQETLHLLDIQPLQVEADTLLLCAPGQANLSVQPLGGVPPFSYLWETSATGSSISPNIASSQDFAVTVSDACGASQVAVAQAQLLPPPSAQLQGSSVQLCPGQSGTLAVDFQGLGPFSLSYTLNGVPQPPLNNISANPFLLPVAQPGTYALSAVSGAGACPGTATGSATVSPSSMSVTGAVGNVRCAGQSDGSINTSISGGQGPYAYAWSGPQAIPPGVADPLGLPVGAYTLTVTDLFGCQAFQQFSIAEPPPLAATVAQVLPVNCYNPTGGSINLEVNGGTPPYTYLWSNQQSVQDPQNLAQGAYSVTVSDQLGCSATLAVSVPANLTPPAAQASTTGLLDCDTQQIALSGSGSSTGANFQYQWTASNGGSIVSGANSLSPLVSQPGSYTLVVTNLDNGCSSSRLVQQLASLQPPVANAGADATLTCANTTLTLSGNGSSNGPSTAYAWSGPGILGGGNSLGPSVGLPGQYTLTVTNLDNGCSSTDQVLISLDNTTPVASIATPALLTCANASVNLNGSGSSPAGLLTFWWSSADGAFLSSPAAASVQVGEAGNYDLVVTNTQNGCRDTASVAVGQDYTEPTAVITYTGQLDCNTPTLTLSGLNSTLIANSSYVWTASNGGAFVSGQNSWTPLIEQPGSYTLLITNNISSCSSVATVLIEEDEAIPAAIVGNPATLTCATDTLTLGDPAANPAFSYSWASNGGNIISGQNGPAAQVDAPGLYTLLVTNPANGCSNSASVSIGENITAPTAQIAEPPLLNCAFPALQLDASASSTGLQYTYNWTSASGLPIPAGGSTLSPTVTASDSYTLWVTDISNGCQTAASVTVSDAFDFPAVQVAAPAVLTCATPVLTLDGSASEQGPNLQFLWGSIDGPILAGQGTPLATIAAPGLYTLLVTDLSNTCSASYSVVVQQDTAVPIADAGALQTLLCSQTVLALDGTGSSTGPDFAYQWQALGAGNLLGPANSLSPQVDDPGLYQLIVTNTQNGCSASDTVPVLSDENEPVAQIAPPGVLNCYFPQLALNAAGSSVGPNFQYSWSGPGIVSGANSAAPQVNAPGLYTLLITNVLNGCTASATAIQLADFEPPVANAGPDTLLNCQYPQVQIGSSATPLPGVALQWSGPGIAAGQTAPLATVGASGWYSLVATNIGNGCSAADAVWVGTDFAAPMVDAGTPFDLNCTENTRVLDAVADTGPAFSYLWSAQNGSFITPANLLNPTVNGPGSYALTVTNSLNGCTATDAVLISQADEVPEALVALPPVFNCLTDSVQLNASGSSAWSSIVYVWTAQPGALLLSGAGGLQPFVGAPGVYTLQVVDTLNNCLTNATVTVLADTTAPVLGPEAPMRLDCVTPAVSIHAGLNAPGSYVYQWGGPQPGAILSDANAAQAVVAAAGAYQLTVTNLGNGCSNTAEVLVASDTLPPPLSVEPPLPLTCAVPQRPLTASSLAGNVLFSWTTANGNILTGNGLGGITADAPGTYAVQVTNLENGCENSATVLLGEDLEPPTVDAGGTATLNCVVSSLQLDGSNSDQGPNFFYQWTTPNGDIVAGANGLAPLIAAPGDYVLGILNFDNGCVARDTVAVLSDLQNPLVQLPPGPELNCEMPQTLIEATVSSGTGSSDLSYVWLTFNGNILGPTDGPSVMVDAGGQYLLIVQNNENGCVEAATVEVASSVLLPDADAGPPFTLTCSVLAVRLQGSASSGPSFGYAWGSATGQIVEGDNTLSPLVNQAGSYQLTVTNLETGCARTDVVEVLRETNVPTGFDYVLENPGCKGNDGRIAFSAVEGGVGPYLYSIDGGDTFVEDIDFEDIVPGMYELAVLDANGCEYFVPLSVPPAPQPGISIAPEFSIEFGAEQQLQAQVAPGYPFGLIDTVLWSPMEGLRFGGTGILDLLRPVAGPLQNTLYTVTLVSKDGCMASDQVRIIVDDELFIYIPNAFSPWNADNWNDEVFVFTSERQVRQVLSFEIFDRWGNMVFRVANCPPNDPDYGWDGRMGGEMMNPAVFVYKAVVELANGKKKLFKGDISLLR
jgi:gliding motility-associated-like protein